VWLSPVTSAHGASRSGWNQERRAPTSTRAPPNLKRKPWPRACIHPKLKDRKLEVWEGLFAVAYVLGGQEWLNRCLAAFKELALAESDQIVLTPKQQTVKDVAAVAAACPRRITLTDGSQFIGGLAIVDELHRLGNPLYDGRSDAGLALLVSDALPMNTVQLRVGSDRVRGYYVQDIQAAWDKIRPDEPDDVEIPDEINPFEIDGEDEPVTGSVAGQQDEEIIPAGQHDVTADSEGFASVLPVVGPVSPYTPGIRDGNTAPFPVISSDDLDVMARHYENKEEAQ
jgi:hypothetical protein